MFAFLLKAVSHITVRLLTSDKHITAVVRIIVDLSFTKTHIVVFLLLTGRFQVCFYNSSNKSNRGLTASKG